jgi:hypothetical protein
MERMLASPADAEIILSLYKLRTETLMRQARAWVTGAFWPTTAEEFLAVSESPDDPHSAWLRQVITYWEMAAAMVLHGAVSAECSWIAMEKAFSCWPSSPRSLRR